MAIPEAEYMAVPNVARPWSYTGEPLDPFGLRRRAPLDFLPQPGPSWRIPRPIGRLRTSTGAAHGFAWLLCWAVENVRNTARNLIQRFRTMRATPPAFPETTG